MAQLLEVLSTSPQFRGKGLTIRDLAEARFAEPSAGYAIWLWGEIEPADRARITFLFNDSDGTGAFMTIVASADNKVREIELWRGDGKPLQRVPKLDALVEAEPGKIY